jgi:uncharacterized protein
VATPYLVIDGYNLLHAAGLAKMKYARGDLERCRKKLLNQIASLLTEEERHRCTVVFDAQDAPPAASRVASFKQITIQFADPGQEADDAIELLLEGHSAPSQVWLVSSDHRLQRAIRRKRGRPLDSDHFLSEFISRAKAARHQAAESDPSPSSKTSPLPVDVDYWLAEFGQVDVANIASLEPEPLPELPGLVPLSTPTTRQPSSAIVLPSSPTVQTDGTNPPQSSSKAATSPAKPDRVATPVDWQRELQALQQLLDSPTQLEAWLATPHTPPPQNP